MTGLGLDCVQGSEFGGWGEWPPFVRAPKIPNINGVSVFFLNSFIGLKNVTLNASKSIKLHYMLHTTKDLDSKRPNPTKT